MRSWFLVLSVFVSSLLLVSSSLAQTPTWKWVSGANGSTVVADFGSRGQFQPTNQPPRLQNAAMWTGPDGNLYLFGGDDGSGHYYNTIWEYSPTLGEWMWKRGSNASGASTVYGTSRFPSETNDPGARTQFAWSTASNGDLWVYGGVDQNSNIFSDLWKYDFALDRWIWYQLWANSSSLNNDTQFPATFGMTGTLGARVGSSLFFEQDSNIVWLFAGLGLVFSSPGMFMDVWKIYVDSSAMYWVGGTSNPDDAGNYSMPPDGVEYNGIEPGARQAQSLWRASDGKFYLFGGKDGGGILHADLWHWNPATNLWGWDWASSYEWYFQNLRPTYAAKGVASSSNEIGSRYSAATWMRSDTDLVVYGGFGYDHSNYLHRLNDFWSFNRFTRVWTWNNGGGPFGDYTLGADSLKPVYGSRGIAADSVYPGGRYSASVAVDAHGTVWLFGGNGYANDGTIGARDDLFEFSTPVPGIFAGGSGTLQDPYQVATITQLQSVNDNRDKYFTLTNDIDASSTATWNPGGLVYYGFQSIGSNASPFTGTLDGNGHVITGLTINRGSTSGVGLFGRIDGVVRNVRLENVSVVGNEYVGGLAGRIVGEVDSCSVSGSVTGSGNAIGGLAGDVYSGSLMMSYSSAAVTGGVFAGEGTGGLVGSVSSGSALANCYATGAVTGNNRVGGLVGNNNGSITRSYASGIVAGDSLAGGLIGASTGVVTQSYWSPSTSGQSASAAGTSLTLAQLESQSSFLGFDFTSTWMIWEGLTSPAFQCNLQSPPPGLLGMSQKVTLNGVVYSFGANHVDLEFTGIAADSTVFAVAGYYNTESDSIAFSTSPPIYHSSYHWVIGAAGSSYASDTLTFSSLSLLPGIPNPSDILIYYRSTVGHGNFALVTSSVAGDSVSVTNALSGEYLFGSNSGPLSVTITEFSGSGGKRDAQLLWRTSTEINNVGWQIERSSTGPHSTASHDKGPWTDVARVSGAGSSTSPKQYAYTDGGLEAGRYSYRLKQLDMSGAFTYSHVVEVEVGAAPRTFTMSQNYPNPFNPTTTIQFTLANDGRVLLKVYDILGREVATLVDENRRAGEYQQAVFNGSQYSTGVYFAVLRSGGMQLVRKLLLVK